MKTGKLTIFTSYTPGAGKSYCMVSKAMEEAQKGKDVSFGFLNGSHREIENRLEANTFTKQREYSMGEIMSRPPQLIVMDEMGMHGINTDDEKTFVYQDIEKILEAGIDVYTTANLKRFQSANPLFKQVTGIGIQKIIPDRFLDRAEKIYFIDREPELMVKDFKCGNLFHKKYMNSKIMKKNFQLHTLISYREISLRYLEKYEEKVEIIIR